MKAGLLKDKIDILSPSVITSEFGENSTSWSVKYSTRANVKVQSHDRTNENNEIFYSSVVEFKVRSYVPVTEWDRIRWKDKQFRVLSLIPSRELQEIKIVSEAVNE